MPNAAPLRILVVDDSEDDLFLMKEVLSSERLRHEVEGVSSGEDALRYLREPKRRPPSLVLLDIHMPGMDGFETLEQIRAAEDLCTIPVVMLTASRREEDMLRSYHDGACSFISKPVTMDAVMDVATRLSRYWSLAGTP